MTIKFPNMLITGLSLALITSLSACSSSTSSDQAATSDNSSSKTAASAASQNAIVQCPDNKVLSSAADYNALTFPNADPKNSKDYAAWHDQNAARDGVVTTETGLQYKVAQAGLDDGASPIGGEYVTVHYHGYFLDGNVFDSSYDRGETIDFPANGVIPGWVEALQDMKTCEARTLYIPGDLAYGKRGNRGIPPNATLLFNVQLIAVDK